MHELAIAQSIFDAVAAKAVECKAVQVKDVRLRIGEASGVVADSLTFCFEMLASLDPLVKGARVSIEAVPHRAHCHACDKEFDVENYIAQCPLCHEWSGSIVSGTELQLLEIEIET